MTPKPTTLGRGTRTASLALASLVLVGVLGAGCDKKKADDPNVNTLLDEDRALADDGADTNLAENDPELLTSSLISSAPAGNLGLASLDIGSDVGPRAFGDTVRALYFPRGCVEATNDPATQTATYTFNACAFGPSGLKRVTGVVKAGYRAGPDELHLDLTADAVQVNRAVIDWHATADITTEPGTGRRTMKWTAQLAGTTAGGRKFERTTSQTVAWTLGEACFELGGTSEGKIRDRDIKTEVTNFRRCRASCPDAGGHIVVTNVAKNKQIELIYDGTTTATFVDTKGNRTPVTLPCSQL